MKVTLEFGTHHYIETYNKNDDVLCPSCGKRTVWESTEGDFYEGNTFLCTNCDCEFSMPSFKTAEGAYKGIIEQLITGIQAKPISKKGN